MVSPIVLVEERSAAGGRPFADSRSPARHAAATVGIVPGRGAPKVGAGAEMPDLVPPMQAAPGQLPDGGDWVVEFAWEGLRCVGHVRPDGLRLRTANGRDVTSSFPELVEPLVRRAPRGGMVLDGTVVAVGEGGLPRRRLLQRRTATWRPSPAVLRRTPVGFVVGDLLWLAGRSTVGLPYRQRRELLEELGLARPPVVVSPSFPVTEAEAVLRTAEEYGAEALHAKHLDAPYRPGRRSRSWLRVPLRRSGLVAVGGWTPADPRRPDSVGALLLGVPDGEGGLHYVGRVGIGSGEEQREIATQLARWRRADPPFTALLPPAVAGDAQWAEPRLVGRVEFTDWTADGRLRLPAWRGLWTPESGDSDGRDAETGEGGAPLEWVRWPGAADIAPEPASQGPATGERASADPAPVPVPAGPSAAVETRRLEQHFVYNALNTIAALMRTDPGRARELLLGFADLTRAADKPEGAPGTLGDELGAVRDYLELEQARFGPRLQVEIAVEDGLHTVPMAPRRVLDAVRAVVQQRIEPRPGGGTVTVTAERSGTGCLIRVGDRDGDGNTGELTLLVTG
jgi:bifunctional non-homologous end joining protein LigD